MKVYSLAGFVYGGELQHHGILGQKWGVRRYQNKDGTLTEEGKKRYYTSDERRSFVEKLESGGGQSVVLTPQFKHIEASIDRSLVNKAHAASQKEIEAEADFYRNEQLRKQYEKRAVEYWRHELADDFDEDFTPNSITAYSMPNGPYRVFLASGDKRAEPYKKIIEESRQANQALYDNVKSYVDDVMGGFGSAPVYSATSVGLTLGTKEGTLSAKEYIAGLLSGYYFQKHADDLVKSR